jgi:hypothetical protein
MRLRIGGFALAVLAFALYGGLVRPKALEVEQEEARYEEARKATNAERIRLNELQRAKASHAAPGQDAMPLRRVVVSCLERRPVKSVRIDLHLQGGRSAIGLSGTGSLQQDLLLVGELLRASISPLRVHLSPTAADVAFSFEGERQ